MGVNQVICTRIRMEFGMRTESLLLKGGEFRSDVGIVCGIDIDVPFCRRKAVLAVVIYI